MAPSVSPSTLTTFLPAEGRAQSKMFAGGPGVFRAMGSSPCLLECLNILHKASLDLQRAAEMEDVDEER